MPLTAMFFMILVLVLLISIYNNIQNFSKVVFFLQGICLILIISVFNSPKLALNTIYKDHQSQVFNTSASFRFMGVSNAFLHSILDTRSFERDLKKHSLVNEYLDFRAFNGELTAKKNIHIIVLESYLDLQGFNNLQFDVGDQYDDWIAWNEKYSIAALSPVSGGGSAQAEFEILCGAKSILEYGTEFNRLGGTAIPCLPNFLKNYGYSTFASQPIYGSFFNARKAYQSIGFDRIWLAENLDMSKIRNGWLPDELFFEQHLKLITPYLSEAQPIVNYLFAVGCHSQNNMEKNKRQIFLLILLQVCLLVLIHPYTYSLVLILHKLEKQLSLLPDHLPPLKSPKLTKMGINQFSNSNIKLKEGGVANNIDLSTANGHINYGYLIHGGEILREKNFAYYEIPEILIDMVSNGELCLEIPCSSKDLNILFQDSFLNRDNFTNSTQSTSDGIKVNYQRELNISLIKQSNSQK